jgi:hypothetical protein
MGDRIARQMPREAPVRTEPHPTIVPSPSVTSVASVRCFPIALFVTLGVTALHLTGFA